MPLHEALAVPLYALAPTAPAPLVLQVLVERIGFLLDGSLHCPLPQFLVAVPVFAPDAPAVQALLATLETLAVHLQTVALLAAAPLGFRLLFWLAVVQL